MPHCALLCPARMPPCPQQQSTVYSSQPVIQLPSAWSHPLLKSIWWLLWDQSHKATSQCDGSCWILDTNHLWNSSDHSYKSHIPIAHHCQVLPKFLAQRCFHFSPILQSFVNSPFSITPIQMNPCQLCQLRLSSCWQPGSWWQWSVWVVMPLLCQCTFVMIMMTMTMTC